MEKFIDNESNPAEPPDGCEIIRTERFFGFLRVPFIMHVRPLYIKYAGNVYAYLGFEPGTEPKKLLYHPRVVHSEKAES